MGVRFCLDLAQCHLRQATSEDLGELKVFLAGLFPLRYSSRFYQQIALGLETKCLMAYWKATLVGLVCFRCEPEASAANSVQILVVGVLPVFQRLGIGSLLVERVKQQYPTSRLYLHVQCSNANALRFYQKHSFFVVERVKDYYSGIPEEKDAFLLEFFTSSSKQPSDESFVAQSHTH